MAVNLDAILKIGADVTGTGNVSKLSDTLIRVSQSAKSVALEELGQRGADMQQKLATSAAAAAVQINAADKLVLESRMSLAQNDKERKAIQGELTSVQLKGAQLQRAAVEQQLTAELNLARAKKQATQLELDRAQAVVSTAGKYGKITPEIMRQAEAARTANTAAEKELQTTTQIVAEKRQVADAQLRASQAQAESLQITEKSAASVLIASRAYQVASQAADAVRNALVFATKSSVEFETSVANVVKVMDGLSTPKAIKEISNEIIDLSKDLPVTAQGFAEIYAAAGASGIARSEVKQFAKDVAGVSIAFDMTADQAGNSIAKLRNSLGMTQPEVMKLADAINYLDQQTSARANQLVEFALRSGAVGQQVGLAAKDTVAFGAAMISAGVETEIASTSFNNMVKALSRGDSMTDRQVSALQTLGLAAGKAATDLSKAQDEMARSAEDRRYENALNNRKEATLLSAKIETEGVLREINYRMDQQLEILNRGLSQEEKQLNRKYRTVEQGERRHTEDLMDELRRRVTGTDAASQAFLKKQQRAIEDESQNRMDAINDRKDGELAILKDKYKQEKQLAKNNFEDLKKDEQDALDAKRKEIESSFTEEKALHSDQQKILKIQQDEAARLSGQSAGLKLSKAMQENALPTIIDIFKRIKNLPKEVQLSTISDLFGDEAKGLNPIIQNMDTLTQALTNVANEGNYAGSMANELKIKMETTAAQAQIAANNVQALQLEIGQQLLPRIKTLLEYLIPAGKAIAGFAREHPTVTLLAAGFTAIAAAVVIAIPPIVAFAFALQGLADLGIGATLASWATGFLTAAASVATFVAGVVTAPVLIAAALIAAGAAIFIFRDSIGKTFQEIWATIADPKTGFIAIIGMAWNNMVDGMKAYLAGMMKPIADTWNAIVNSVRGAINGAIRLAGQGINALIEQANRLLSAYNAVANVTHLPQVGLIQYVNVPQFAEGGRVDRPTYLLAGEAGPEYIVPQSKVPQFVGAHMGDTGLGLNGARGGGGQAPVVNVQTGPIMQQPDGSRWVSMEDAQTMVGDVADQIWRGLTSYDGRRALGLVR